MTTLRNFRLPVRKLLAGQFGTVGISSSGLDETKGDRDLPSRRVRRGMVLIRPLNGSNSNNHLAPPMYRLFSGIFDDLNSRSMMPRMQVTVYIASIKASAKILTVQTQVEPQRVRTSPDEVFLFGDNYSRHKDSLPTLSRPAFDREVTFQFVSSREWVEIGGQVLIMPAGGSGMGRSDGGDSASASLEGFVGKITKAME